MFQSIHPVAEIYFIVRKMYNLSLLIDQSFKKMFELYIYIKISASLFPLFYIEFWIWNELILINCSYFFAIVYYVSVIYVSDVNLYYKNQILNYFFYYIVLGEALNNFENDNII